MLQQIKPTRMELLKLRRRVSLAQKGHHLLKEKRDALFSEFYGLLKKARELRSDVENTLERAYFMLAMANAQFSSLKVSEFAIASSSRNSRAKIDISKKNIMGAHVPLLDAQKIKRSVLERGYSLVGSGCAVDEAADNFEEALEKIVKLAEMEATLERLAFEINKTKRKVNSLEKVVIPRMKSLQHYIEFRLEEREREGIFMLKKMKKRLK